jgi:hypothetical protein
MRNRFGAAGNLDPYRKITGPANRITAIFFHSGLNQQVAIF